MITLSDDQNEALRLLRDEMASGNPFVTLGGYAGSGKSTLIPHIAAEMGQLHRTAFVTYTGKASQVLREKLRDAGVLHQVAYVGTIHGLIYKLVEEKKTGEMIWKRRSRLSVDGDDWADPDTPGVMVVPSEGASEGFLNGWRVVENPDWGGDSSIVRIFVDEVSMVGKKVLDDLLVYKVPILAVGDPAQLPPIQDESVLLDPDVLLTQVHRQAEGNPIIRIATHVREHGMLPPDVPRISYEEAGDIVTKAQAEDPLDVAILARTNRARTVFNGKLYGQAPQMGHVVICLRNNWPLGLYNGLRGIVSGAPEHWNTKMPHLPLHVNFPDLGMVKYLPQVNTLQFGREKTVTQHDMSEAYGTLTTGSLFDFGTALTVHKAQGSGFGTVLVSPDQWGWNRNEKEDWPKWLYTAVTRAVRDLHILPDWG